MHRWIEAVLSLTVVAVALYIIVARSEDEAARQWAVGAIAFVLGYYLRGNEPHVPR
jgi:hypothetical protein